MQVTQRKLRCLISNSPFAFIMFNLYKVPRLVGHRRRGLLLPGEAWELVTLGPFCAGAYLVPSATGQLRAM